MEKIACSDAVHVTCANKVKNGPASAKHGCSVYSQTKQLPCPRHILNISLSSCIDICLWKRSCVVHLQ